LIEAHPVLKEHAGYTRVANIDHFHPRPFRDYETPQRPDKFRATFRSILILLGRKKKTKDSHRTSKLLSDFEDYTLLAKTFISFKNVYSSY
jgi:hypothetical protein